MKAEYIKGDHFVENIGKLNHQYKLGNVRPLSRFGSESTGRRAFLNYFLLCIPVIESVNINLHDPSTGKSKTNFISFCHQNRNPRGFPLLKINPRHSRTNTLPKILVWPKIKSRPVATSCLSASPRPRLPRIFKDPQNSFFEPF